MKFIENPTVAVSKKLYKIGSHVEFYSCIYNGTGCTCFEDCIVSNIIDEANRVYEVTDLKTNAKFTAQDQDFDEMQYLNGSANSYYMEHLLKKTYHPQ